MDSEIVCGSVRQGTARDRAPYERPAARILLAQYHAPNRTAYATQIARVAAVPGGHPTVNAQYGRLGHMFCDAMGFEGDRRKNGTSRWWAVWSQGHPGPKGLTWEMLPEVAQALEDLGWVPSTEFALPDEVPTGQTMVEGAVSRIQVNAYERNPEARRRCLATYGTVCCICNFDFAATYGREFEGFIHVHHLRPLSEIGGAYVVDPVAELRPVCPNCHAVIHHRGELRGIAEVKRLIASAAWPNQALSLGKKSSLRTPPDEKEFFPS